jgi:hypothetical protein
MAMATRPEPPAQPRSGGAGATAMGRERAFGLIVGAILVVLGLAGSLGTPLVGGPDDTGLLVTGPGHDIAHLILGALYLHVALALDGRLRADGLLVLGTTVLATGILSLVSPDLFGLYGAATGIVDQLMHLVVGVFSIGFGFVARSAVLAQERRVGSQARAPRRR